MKTNSYNDAGGKTTKRKSPLPDDVKVLSKPKTCEEIANAETGLESQEEANSFTNPQKHETEEIDEDEHDKRGAKGEHNLREEEADEDVHGEDEEHQRDQPTRERKAEGEHSIQEEEVDEILKKKKHETEEVDEDEHGERGVEGEDNLREEEADEDIHGEDEVHQRDQPTWERSAVGEHSLQEEEVDEDEHGERGAGAGAGEHSLREEEG